MAKQTISRNAAMRKLRIEAERGLVHGVQPAMPTDAVNHPAHYTQGAVECIDAIESALGLDGFVAFLRGQVIKYTWRLLSKVDPVQDSQKLNWYAQRLETVLTKKYDGA